MIYCAAVMTPDGYLRCPRCRFVYERLKALSRRDNHTMICAACGALEAFEDAGMLPSWIGHVYWDAARIEEEGDDAA